MTAKDRLQAARAERRSLLRRLAGAQTDAEAEAFRRRLDLVSGEINGLRSQLRDLRLRTDYAVVTVHLAGDGSGRRRRERRRSATRSTTPAGCWSASPACSSASWRWGSRSALIALLAWLAARGVRRRRRESALA